MLAEKMKYFLLLLSLTLLSVPEQAQAQSCVDVRVVTVSGGYDEYGNYYPPTTRPVETAVPCNYGINNYNYQYYQRNFPVQVCNGTGAAIGAGIAGSITGGNRYTSSGSYSNSYNRNGSSGSWKRTWTNNNSSILLGAGIGSLLLGC